MFLNKNNDLVYLLRILQYIGKIETITVAFNSSKELYDTDNQTTYNACLTLLTQIGENTTKISIETKICYDLIEWQKIKDFRNLIVHDYTGLIQKKVFYIIKNDLLSLKTYIESIIKNEIILENFDLIELKLASTNEFYKFVNFKNLIKE